MNFLPIQDLTDDELGLAYQFANRYTSTDFPVEPYMLKFIMVRWMEKAIKANMNQLNKEGEEVLKSLCEKLEINIKGNE